MADLEQSHDEAVDAAFDLPVEETEEGDVEEEAIEAEEQESEQIDEAEPDLSEYGRFEQSENWEDLPEKARRIYRNVLASNTKHAQEAAELRRRLDALEAPAEPEAPGFDTEVDGATFAKQVEDRIAYEVEKRTKHYEEQLQSVGQKMTQAEQRSAQERLYNHVVAKEGFSKAVESKMESLIKDNPNTFGMMVSTEAGLDLVFEEAQRQLASSASKQVSVQKAKKAQKGTQLRGKSSSADPVALREEYKGMDPRAVANDIFNKFGRDIPAE